MKVNQWLKRVGAVALSVMMLITMLSVCGFVLAEADPTAVYVDFSTGDDANEGTETSPLKTAKAAVNKVNALGLTGENRNIIFLGDGVGNLDMSGANAYTENITIYHKRNGNFGTGTLWMNSTAIKLGGPVTIDSDVGYQWNNPVDIYTYGYDLVLGERFSNAKGNSTANTKVYAGFDYATQAATTPTANGRYQLGRDNNLTVNSNSTDPIEIYYGNKIVYNNSYVPVQYGNAKLVLNTKMTIAKLKIGISESRAGNDTTSVEGARYEGLAQFTSLKIKVDNVGAISSFMINSYQGGVGAGSVQAIFNNGTWDKTTTNNFNWAATAWTQDGIATSNSYVMKSASTEAALDFTDTVGTFAVTEGYTATAGEAVSENGKLVAAKGTFDVTIAKTVTTTAAPAVSMKLPESIIVTNGAGTQADPVVIKHDAGRFVPVITNAASGSYIYLYEAAKFDNVGYADYSDYNTPGNTIPSGAGGRTYLAVAETLPEGSYVLALDDKGDLGSSSGSFDVVIYFNVEAAPATSTTEATTTTTTEETTTTTEESTTVATTTTTTVAAVTPYVVTLNKTTIVAGEDLVASISDLPANAYISIFTNVRDNGQLGGYTRFGDSPVLTAGTTTHTFSTTGMTPGRYAVALHQDGWAFPGNVAVFTVEAAPTTSTTATEGGTTTTTTAAAVTPSMTYSPESIQQGGDVANLTITFTGLPQGSYTIKRKNPSNYTELGYANQYDGAWAVTPDADGNATVTIPAVNTLVPGTYQFTVFSGWDTVQAGGFYFRKDFTVTAPATPIVTPEMKGDLTEIKIGEEKTLTLTITGLTPNGQYLLRRANPAGQYGTDKPYTNPYDGAEATAVIGTVRDGAYLTMDDEGNCTVTIDVSKLKAVGAYQYRLFEGHNWGGSWTTPTGKGFNFDFIVNPEGAMPDPTISVNKTTIAPGYTFSFTIENAPAGAEFGLLKDDGTGKPVNATLVSGSYKQLAFGYNTQTVTVNEPGNYVASVWTSGWNHLVYISVTVEAPTTSSTTSTTVGGGTTPTTPVGGDAAEVAKNAAENHAYHNKSNASDAKAAVEAALAAAGYNNSVAIENWHLIRAVAGAKDQDGIIWEGYEGHVAATIVLDGTTYIDFTATVEPGMTEYEFASVAKQVEPFRPMTEADAENNVDWEFYTGLYPGCQISYTSDGGFFVISEDGKLFIAYSGTAEKIIFPEGVERLVNASVDDGEDWWYETELANVRCLILPDSLKILPDQFAVPFRGNIECVIMGDNVTEAHGWHTFHRCFYLKTLRLSENLENLTEESLFQCLSLYDFRLPTNLKTIAKGALHLSALRDIYVPAGVEYIAQEAFAWPMRSLQMLNPRPQGNEVSQDVIDELEPAYREAMWRDPTNRETYITRSLYILTDDAEYQDTVQSFWNSNWGVQTVYCYYIDGSSTADLIAGGYTGGSDGSVTNSTFDMDKNHVIVALEDVADRLVVGATTTEADLLAQFLKNVYSTKVTNINLKNVEIDNATGAASGEVYGTVSGSRAEVLLITFNVEGKTTTTTEGGETTTTTQGGATTTTQGGATTTTIGGGEGTTTTQGATTTTTTVGGGDVDTPDTGYEVPVMALVIVLMTAAGAVFFLRKKVTE